MVIIGCDYHPSMQQIAWYDNRSGAQGEGRLEHASGEAEKFYRELKQRGVQVRVGLEASGHTRWFERLLAELEMELWIGNPAKIAGQRVRKQKTDREDARLLLIVMMLLRPQGLLGGRELWRKRKALAPGGFPMVLRVKKAVGDGR